MKIRLVAVNAKYVYSCLALFYVRNELNRHLDDARVEIVQCTINDPCYRTALSLVDEKPDAVFFSVYIWNEDYIGRLVSDLKKILPGAIIVLGGPQVTYSDNNVYPPGVTIVKGEIEGVPYSFYKDLVSGELKPVYPCGHGNTFSFPYQEDDFDTQLKNRYVYYESSRGCPFSCAYCLSSGKQKIVYKDVRTVEGELKFILDHAPRQIRFVDRTFNSDMKRAVEIWRFIKKQKTDTTFHFEIAPDRFNEEMFHALEDIPPGKFQFEIGIQSTSGPVMDAVQRKTCISEGLANIKRLVSMESIYLHVDLILGLPFETETSFKKSFNDIFSLLPHYIQMGLLKILPGTSINSRREELGIVSMSDTPYGIFQNRWLDHNRMRYLYSVNECIEAFYNNRFFRAVWIYIKKNREDAYAFFERLHEVCTENAFFSFTAGQELLCRMLFELSRGRNDHDTLKELLVYEWLRSGHRHMPDYLFEDQVNNVRDFLWNLMPQTWENVYSEVDRNRFFRQGVFMRFRGETLKIIFSDVSEDRYVCFLPETDGGLNKKQRVILIPDSFINK